MLSKLNVKCKDVCVRCCPCRNPREPTVLANVGVEDGLPERFLSLDSCGGVAVVAGSFDVPSETSSEMSRATHLVEPSWWGQVASFAVCKRRRRPDAAHRQAKAAQPLPVLEDGRSLASMSTSDPSVSRASSRSVASAQSSQVAKATLWLRRYANTIRSVSSPHGERLIQVNLLAATFEHFCPLLANLTPKIELPKNIKKLRGGAAPGDVGMDARPFDVRKLPPQQEGPRAGFQWAFFEFEFAVLSLARILQEIKMCCDIADDDTKETFLQKIQKKAAQRSKPSPVSVYNIVTKVFASSLALHQRCLLQPSAARALSAMITTGMQSMRFTSMSKFMGLFDFASAEEWRDFLAASAEVCDILREDVCGMMDWELAVPNEESDQNVYSEACKTLQNICKDCDRSTWWQLRVPLSRAE